MARLSKYTIKKGEVYGYWKVLEDPISGSPYVLCHCLKCDLTTKSIWCIKLLNKTTTSCRCKTQISQIKLNSTFGYWKVLKRDKGHFFCTCLGCNNTGRIHFADLLQGRSKSCGCKKRELTELTNLNKFGFRSPAQDPKVLQKMKGTCLSLYGKEYVSQTDWFQTQVRKTKVEKGNAVPLELQTKKELYYRLVRSLTEKTYRKYVGEFEAQAKRGSKNQLDHIFSIADGFKNNILPKVMSSRINLQLLPSEENKAKSSDSWISKEELLKKYGEMNNG